MSHLQPVSGRLFRVEVQDLPASDTPEVFYSVKGLERVVQHILEPYIPGGFDQPFYLPDACQQGTLTLIRPVLRQKTGLTKWCEEALGKMDFSPTWVHILVLDAQEKIVVEWLLEGAYPIGVSVAPLGVDGQAGIIEESITLAYAKLSRS